MTVLASFSPATYSANSRWSHRCTLVEPWAGSWAQSSPLPWPLRSSAVPRRTAGRFARPAVGFAVGVSMCAVAVPGVVVLMRVLSGILGCCWYYLLLLPLLSSGVVSAGCCWWDSVLFLPLPRREASLEVLGRSRFLCC